MLKIEHLSFVNAKSKLILFLALIFLANFGWADNIKILTGREQHDFWVKKIAEAQERNRRSKISIGTTTHNGTEKEFLQHVGIDPYQVAHTTWVVIGQTQKTLDDFVSSGKLCDWRGFHAWRTISEKEDFLGWKEFIECTICHLRKIRRQP